MKKGKQEFEKKNYSVALLYFKNAIAAQPQDAEPYYQLGLTYQAANDIRSAAPYFRKACDLNPKHTGAQLRLATLMVAAGGKDIVEDAKKRMQDVLNREPNNVEAMNILAIAEVRSGNPDAAEKRLEQAIRTSPTYLNSYVALAETRLVQKNAAGAEQALQLAVAQVPRSPQTRLSLGQFYLRTGRANDAERQFRLALTMDPKNGPALLALAQMQVRAGQMDQADQTYRQLAALPDKQYRPLHAMFLFQTGKTDQAVAEFQKLAAADPADRNVRTALVSAYLALKRVGDAEKVLGTALNKNSLDVDALLQRSRIYLGEGKYTEAQADLNHVLHFRSDSVEAHYLLSKVAAGRGDATMRKQELGQVLRLDPAYITARIELSQVLLANRAAQSALQLLDDAPAEQKNNAGLILQRNWALMALGQLGEARTAVNRVMAAGTFPEALLQDAILKMNQKDYAGARAAAEAVLVQAPAEVRALNVLLQSYVAQNQKAAGIQKVREYAARQPFSAAVQEFYGQLLLADHDAAGARKAFEAAKAADPGLISADLALALLDVDVGKRQEAQTRLSALVAAHPSNLPAHFLLAQIEMQQGDIPSSIEQYRKALQLDENNADVLNNLAYLLADSKRPDEALRYAQKAKELAPQSPAVDDTLGWTYYQKGMYKLAVTYLENATAREDTARRRYHLAMAYLKAGDAKRGRQTLDMAMKMDRSLPEARTAQQIFQGAAN